MLAMTGRIILGSLITIAVGLFIAVKFDVEKVPPPPLEKPKQNIEVFLPQKIDSNNGEWGNFKDKSLQHSREIKEGSIKINLPSGRMLNYEVAYGYMYQTNQTLDRLRLTLPLGIYDYQEAINNLEKNLKKLSVENSQECISGLKKLREEKNPDRYTEFTAGCFVKVEKGIELMAGLTRFLIASNSPRTDLKPNLGFATVLEFRSTQQEQQQTRCCKQN